MGNKTYIAGALLLLFLGIFFIVAMYIEGHNNFIEQNSQLAEQEGLKIIRFSKILEIDNTKEYNQINNTIKVKNLFGIGPEIAELELKTPQVYNVVRGNDRKVAEFEINLKSQRYNNLFDDMEFYDLNNNNNSINKKFTLKSWKKVGVNEIEEKVLECTNKTAIYDKTVKTEVCDYIKTGKIILEDNYDWVPLDKSNLNIEKGITKIGVFTDVAEGETIEWIPNLMGIRINEWATWNESFSNGLIAYYAFEESSGTNLPSQNGTNNATLINSPTWVTTGKIGNGLQLSRASAQYANITTFEFPTGASAKTVCGWFNITLSTTTQFLIHGGAYNNNQWFGIGFSWSSDNKFWIPGYTSDVVAPSLSTRDVWHYVCAADNGSGKRLLYVDGINVVNGTATYNYTAGKSIKFGSEANTGQYMTGIMDEVSIHNRELSANEISYLYDSGAGTTYSSGSTNSTAVNITVTISSPANSTTFNTTTVTINSTLTATNGNLTNATRYIWNSSNYLINLTTNNISGNTTNSTIWVINLSDGIYYSNVYGCAINNTNTICRFATHNITFTVNTSSQPNYNWSASLQSGLDVYLKLDESSGSNALNFINPNKNATTANTPVWTSGKINNGLQFLASSSQYANISAYSMPNGTKTVSLWVNRTATGNTMMVLDSGCASGSKCAFGIGNGYSAGDYKFWIHGQSADVVAPSGSSLNVWYHVVAVEDGHGNRYLYVNGINVANGSNAVNMGTQPVILGAYTAGGGSYLTGMIDEIAIWNRNLTNSEIAYIYGQGSPSQPDEIDDYSSLNISISVTSPTNNQVITSNLTYTYNSSLTATNGNLTNATLRIWNSTGSLVNSTFNSLSGSINSTSNTVTLINGSYVTNIYGCAVNSSSYVCTISNNVSYNLSFTPPSLPYTNGSFRYSTTRYINLTNLTSLQSDTVPIRIKINSSFLNFSAIRSDCRDIAFYDYNNVEMNSMLVKCNLSDYIDYRVNMFINTSNYTLNKINILYGNSTIQSTYTNIYANEAVVYLMNETLGSSSPVNYGDRGQLNNTLHSLSFTGYSLTSGNDTYNESWMEGSTSITLNGSRTYNVVFKAFREAVPTMALDLIHHGSSRHGYSLAYGFSPINYTSDFWHTYPIGHVNFNYETTACDAYAIGYDYLRHPYQGINSFTATDDGYDPRSDSGVGVHINTTINFALLVNTTGSGVCGGTTPDTTSGVLHFGMRAVSAPDSWANFFRYAEAYQVIVTDGVKSQTWARVQYKNYADSLLEDPNPTNGSSPSNDSTNPDIVYQIPFNCGSRCNPSGLINYTNPRVSVSAVDNSTYTVYINLYNSNLSLNYSESFSAAGGVLGSYRVDYNLSDGTYYYNATVNDSYGNSNYVETRSFTILTSPVSITALSPIQNINYAKIGNNLNFSFVAVSANLSSCWYNYSGTIYYTSCTSNIPVNASINLTSSKVVTIFANTTSNIVSSINLTFPIDIFEITASYNNVTYETSRDYFAINFTTQNIVSTTAYLNYNGTNYLSTVNCSGQSCLAWNNVSIPVINAMQLNNSFNWIITVYNGTSSVTSNSSTFTHSVLALVMNNCSSGNLVFNFTTWNEITRTKFTHIALDATFKYYLGDPSVYKVYNLTETSVLNHEINVCINTNSTVYTDAILAYYSDALDAPVRNIFYQGHAFNSTTQHVKLYLLDTGNSTSFILQVQDRNVQPMKNVLVNAQRCYVGLNSNETVFVHRTDSNGLTVGNLQAETALYQFFITNYSQTLLAVTPCAKVIPQTAPYTLLFQLGDTYESPFTDIQNSNGASSRLYRNKSTNVITWTYTDTSGNFTGAQLIVLNLNSSGADEPVVCSASSNISSGTLTCNVTEGNTYSIQGFIYRTGQTIRDQIVEAVQSFYQVGGYSAAFLGFFLILVAAFAFKFNEIAGIWLVFVACFISNYFGLIGFGYVWITAQFFLSLIITAVLER